MSVHPFGYVSMNYLLNPIMLVVFSSYRAENFRITSSKIPQSGNTIGPPKQFWLFFSYSFPSPFLLHNPSWWWSWWLGSSPLNWFLPKVSKNIWYMGYLRRNSNQELSCTWRTFLIILTFLMAIIMIGIISIELQFT